MLCTECVAQGGGGERSAKRALFKCSQQQTQCTDVAANRRKRFPVDGDGPRTQQQQLATNNGDTNEELSYTRVRCTYYSRRGGGRRSEAATGSNGKKFLEMKASSSLGECSSAHGFITPLTGVEQMETRRLRMQSVHAHSVHHTTRGSSSRDSRLYRESLSISEVMNCKSEIAHLRPPTKKEEKGRPYSTQRGIITRVIICFLRPPPQSLSLLLVLLSLLLLRFHISCAVTTLFPMDGCGAPSPLLSVTPSCHSDGRQKG